MRKPFLMTTLMTIFVLTAGLVRSQEYQWAKSIGGSGNDNCQDIAVDSSGNVYITGNLEGSNVDFDPGPGTAYLSSAGGVDIFIAKYDSLGNYLWAKSIGGVQDDIGARVATDASGNVYITGWFASVNVDFNPGPGSAILSSLGYTDGYLASYSPDGSYRWAFGFGSPWYEGSHDLFIDNMGHVYITGYFHGTNVDFDPGPGTAFLSSPGNSGDIFLAKYTTGGAFDWVKQVSGNDYEVANGIVADNAGHVFLTGGFHSNVDFDPGTGSAVLTSAGGYDIFLARYDSSGNYLWACRFGGSGDDIGSDVSMDHSGNPLMVATFKGTGIDFDPGVGTALLNSNGGRDFVVVKLDGDGNYMWANSTGGPQDDYALKVVVDPQENVYYTGVFRGTGVDFDPGPGKLLLSSAGEDDIYFAVASPDGKFLRVRKTGGAFSDWGNSIALTRSGAIRVGGCFMGNNIDFDPGPGTAPLSANGGADIFMAGFSRVAPGGAYFGQPAPGLIPEPFAPAFIIPDQSPNGYFGITFSPGGDECFFGMYPDIKTSKMTNGIWPDPVTAPFSGTNNDMEACITPDDQKLFFTSDRPLQGAPQNFGRIWHCNRTTGGWSDPEPIEQPLRDLLLMFPSLTMNKDLYLSTTDGTNQWISVSRFVNGHYQQPGKLSDSVNFNDFTGHSFIAPDESYIIFDVLDHMAGDTICRDLYICDKNPQNTWSTAKSLGDSINTFNGNEVCPFVSRDNKYLFFTRDGNLFWVSAENFLPQVGIGEHNGMSSGPLFRRVYPNPASDLITIDYSLRRQSVVTISFSDILGKPLQRITLEEKPAGDQTITTPVNFLNPGIYLLTLSDQENSITAKLFIRK